jgi:hypothetical protein
VIKYENAKKNNFPKTHSSTAASIKFPITGKTFGFLELYVGN